MNNTLRPFTFPSATLADEVTGFLGVGANWHPETLIDAYKKGIFPWPYPEIDGIPWFSPPKRAILEISTYKPKPRFLRELKSCNFSYKANSDFNAVIGHCRNIKRKKLKDLPNTSWITKDMETAYIDLYELGIAHSIEVYKENKLVGGLYGVLVNNIFAAESMFRLCDSASKASFHAISMVLQNLGLKYLDCQIISPHLSSWGVREITRDEFLSLLIEKQEQIITFPKGPLNIRY